MPTVPCIDTTKARQCEGAPSDARTVVVHDRCNEKITLDSIGIDQEKPGPEGCPLK